MQALFDRPKAQLFKPPKQWIPGSTMPSWRSGSIHGYCVKGGRRWALAPTKSSVTAKVVEDTFQVIFGQCRANEQLLARASAEGNRFPAVRGRHRNSHSDFAFCIPNGLDDPWNHRSNRPGIVIE